jgi:hypothetical protein
MLAIALAAPRAGAMAIEKVIPFATAERVRIQVTIRGDGAAGAVELNGRIAAAAGNRATLWEGSLGTIQAPAGASAVHEKIVEHLKPQLWTPATPALYDLTVTASRSGKKMATQTVRIGFRTFQAKDGHFYLNGRPIFMRGLAISPPGRSVPKSTTDQRAFAEAYIRYLRGQHVNLIRLSDESQMWFDVCDELGMMVYQGFYSSPPTGLTKAEQAAAKAAAKAAGAAPKNESKKDAEDEPEDVNVADPGVRKLLGQVEGGGKQLPRNFDKSFEGYKASFETYARHPAIVIYVLSNEMPYKGESGKLVHDFLSKMYERLAQWDDSRAYIGNAGYGEGREGDINDVHRYWGWYYNTFATFFNLRDVKLFGEAAKNQPLTFSECVGNFTGPNGAYNVIERKQLAAALGWTGHAGDQTKQAQEYQGFTVKQITELFRRLRPINPRISGVMPFTITFHNWRGVKTFDQMIPTAAAQQFGISYQPVLLSWELWTPQVYSGSRINPIAHVINDADDFIALSGATLHFEIQPKQGAPMVKGEVAISDVPYYGTWQRALALQLPGNAPTGEYTLEGSIVKDGKVISINSQPLFIAGAEWQQPVKIGTRRIKIYDPSGATQAALKKRGINAESITGVAGLSGADCLIIGERAWDAYLAKSTERLREFVKSGGRIICLGQMADRFDPSWLATKVTLSKTTVNSPEYPAGHRPTRDQMHVNPERPDHPVLAGVDRDRLKMWSDYSDWNEAKAGFPKIYPVEYGFTLNDAADLAHTSVIADYDRGLEGMALVEMFDGKGSVLLCGLDLIGRAGLDPAADRILGNMIRYMSSDLPHPVHPTITQTIEWGNYPTQRGVISGPINGLFINTEFIPPPTDPTAKSGDKNTGWNTRPSDQWTPRGVRPRGPFYYTFNCSPRDGVRDAGERSRATENTPGTGEFWASLPPGRRTVLNLVHNPQGQSARLEVTVNDARPTVAEIPAGKTLMLRTPITAHVGDVHVRYHGSRKLVILETAFE